MTGESHRGSELAGPAMDPAGDRFYFSSQRGDGLGISPGFDIGSGFGVTYEIKGPFRKARVLGAEAPAAGRPPAPQGAQPPSAAPGEELPSTGVGPQTEIATALLGAGDTPA